MKRSRMLAGVAFAMVCLAAPPAEAAKKKPVPAAAPAPPPPSVRSGVDLWRTGDYAGAIAIWQPFAAQGDPDAMFNMGQAYKLGRTVPKDLVVARDYYRKAALKGHLPAQANLGILLFQAGEKPEATRWLKAAADRNEMRAQYVLGIAHWNGDGVPRSLTLAYAYLARASAQGLTEASGALNTLTGVISPLERANGWAVATSLAAGNGIPAEFAGATGKPLVVAGTAPLADPVLPAQVIKPLPRPADPPAEAARAAAPPPQAALQSAAPVVTTRKPLPVVTRTDLPAAQPLPVTPPPAVALMAPPRGEPPSAAEPAAVKVEKPAEKSPEKPAAKPVAKAAETPPEKKIIGWRVQLGAFSKRALAENSWKEFAARQKQLVGDRKPIYAPSGNVTKLQLGPYKSKTAAREACDTIAKSGRACFATEN